MSRTCSNDESSGLESDEQMSTSRNNDGGDSLCDTEDADNITNKTSDTQYEDCNVLDRDSRRQIARNRRKHHLNQIEDNEEDMIVDDNDETLDFKHINASCGVTPLYRSNDGMSKIPEKLCGRTRKRRQQNLILANTNPFRASPMMVWIIYRPPVYDTCQQNN